MNWRPSNIHSLHTYGVSAFLLLNVYPQEILEWKKILGQPLRARFLRDLKFPPFSPLHSYVARKKRAGLSNHVKNRVLESWSNIFFPLGVYMFLMFLFLLFFDVFILNENHLVRILNALRLDWLHVWLAVLYQTILLSFYLTFRRI